ncbi:OsmC family protein [Gammaproteobacteria bacterium AB-CW1]|uniref:OsmC family protein n=1 Tax=Natronospira elongata TaxID=3110268 RepID=A0AAP6JHF4_9GAMM|nr:OsmC family protein [Gammaproteobacteria bacterium AB-CW1]
MQSLPHVYKASASGGPDGPMPLDSPGLATLDTDAPAEFGGSGDYWSPETLLVGAVANCFILTFRALSRHAKLEWTSLAVAVEGTLNKTDSGLRFTHFEIRVQGDESMGEAHHAVLENAKKHCLITNSLLAECSLRIEGR